MPILENWILKLLHMNKIYIKKRILKGNKKDEDLIENNIHASYSTGLQTDRKRKRKMHKKVKVDNDEARFNQIESENSSNSNRCLSNDCFKNSKQQKLENSFILNTEKISREERKLQYYLERIQRQEDAEKQSKSKQEIKRFKTIPRQDSNNWIKTSKHNCDLKNKEGIKICIIVGPDNELDELAKSLINSRSSSQNALVDNPVISQNNSEHAKDLKDDISITQSENQNESTFDKIKTPIQSLLKSPSLYPNWDDISSFIFKWEQELTGNKMNEAKYLTNDICSLILSMTKRKQEEIRKTHNHLFRHKSESNLLEKVSNNSWNDAKCYDQCSPLKKNSSYKRSKTLHRSINLCNSESINMLQTVNNSKLINWIWLQKKIFCITREKKIAPKILKHLRLNSFSASVGSKLCSSDNGNKPKIITKNVEMKHSY